MCHPYFTTTTLEGFDFTFLLSATSANPLRSIDFLKWRTCLLLGTDIFLQDYEGFPEWYRTVYQPCSWGFRLQRGYFYMLESVPYWIIYFLYQLRVDFCPTTKILQKPTEVGTNCTYSVLCGCVDLYVSESKRSVITEGMHAWTVNHRIEREYTQITNNRQFKGTVYTTSNCKIHTSNRTVWFFSKQSKWTNFFLLLWNVRFYLKIRNFIFIKWEIGRFWHWHIFQNIFTKIVFKFIKTVFLISL